MYCSQCGAEAHGEGRFCRECGHRFADDTVPAKAADEATRSAPAVPDSVAASDETTEEAAVPATATMDAPAATPAELQPVSARTLNPRVLVAIAGGLALVVVLVLLVRGLSGEGGGADSPEEALRGLAAAVQEEDPVAALKMVEPGEIQSLPDLVDAATGKAHSSKLSASSDSPFQGLDLNVALSGISVHEVADGIARIDFQADYDYEFNPRGFGAALRVDDQGDARRPTDGSGTVDHDCLFALCGDGSNFVMAVERDGRWYLSPAYTMLELWRLTDGLSSPDFATSDLPQPVAATSPEDAVRQFLDAAGRLDAGAAIEHVAPDELPAVYDYRQAIVEGIANARADDNFSASVTFDDLRLAPDGDSGTVRVYIDRASGSFSYTTDDESSSGTWSVDGICMQTQATSSDRFGSDSDAINGCLRNVSGVREPYIVAVERDGGWYVSPVATVSDLARELVENASDDLVLAAIGVPQLGDVTGEISDGQRVSGVLEADDFIDIYTFEARAGESVRFEGNTSMYLFRDNGESASDCSDGYICGATQRLPVDGTYRLVVGANAEFPDLFASETGEDVVVTGPYDVRMVKT